MPPRKGRKQRTAEYIKKPKQLTAKELKSEKMVALIDQEFELRSGAIKAIKDTEIDNLLCRFLFMRSNISKEQLDSPALDFFQQNLASARVIKNDKYKIFELELPEDSLQRNLARRSIDDLQFSFNSVKSNFLEAANVKVLGAEASENYFMGFKDAFQTPGETSSRSSFGTTPKNSRQPKNGEMLLSVRGSPLGVYKEENLEAIIESDRSNHTEVLPDT